MTWKIYLLWQSCALDKAPDDAAVLDFFAENNKQLSAF